MTATEWYGKEEPDAVDDYDMEVLTKKVIAWGDEKGINNPTMQLCKCLEELGEVAHEVTRGSENTDAIKDAIGDTLVTVIVFAHISGYDPAECLKLAYDEIKGRKGKIVDGSFVKDNQ